MRLAFLTLLAVSLMPSIAAASGKTDNGTPFPSQAFGVRFGMSPSEFEKECKHAGGKPRLSDAPGGGFDAVVGCSTPLVAPSGMTPPGVVMVGFCEGRACQVVGWWFRVAADEANETEASFVRKYGTTAVYGPTPRDLLGRCADEHPPRRISSWIFTEADAKTKRDVVRGDIRLRLTCWVDHTMTQSAVYSNDLVLARTVALANENF